jgi:pyruvate/2-oxoglutarate dehydrogenase complex dihydrolipoamide acyltransferase (E2) component
VCVGLTYRSPELQRQIDERNTRIARQTHQQELADLRQRFAPEIERAERLVNLVCFQQADGLIGLPPRLRDADQVRAAVAALATLDEELEAIERQVNATGPYQTEAVEQIRQVIGSEMAEQRQLVDMCRQFLQDTNADESRWREQVMQLDVAASQWRAHRRALRPFAVER